jgi:hypothetical protein
MVDSGLLDPANRRLVRRAPSPEAALAELLAAVVAAEPQPTGEWITEAER